MVEQLPEVGRVRIAFGQRSCQECRVKGYSTICGSVFSPVRLRDHVVRWRVGSRA
jgi:hypothetical protein